MKINILFITNKQKVNSKGLCPIMCRLTYNKNRKTFSTGQFINPNNWDSKKQIVKPPELDLDTINNQLSLIKTKLNKAFLLLQVKDEFFSLEDIYSLYLGKKTQKEYNVVEYFEMYLNKLKTLVGIDIKQVTWNKFDYVKTDIQTFIKWKFKVNDIPLRKLEANFLTELEYYLKVKKKKLKQVTINKKIQRFRKVVKVAVAENFLEKDPFILYKTKTVKIEVVFLTPEELKKLEEHEFTQPRLQFVKDLFIFCCYTGLPYRELMDLKYSNIIKGFDGNKWIKMKREKTSKALSIPLLPKALEIIERYGSSEKYVFARISNQRYNSYLKEIAAIIGIDKNFTTHMARRTFASTVLLYNDVPMEIVSELLGHSNMKITQDSYGKVVQKKVSLEIDKVRKLGRVDEKRINLETKK
ncbi:tyrosine-type recombinase/integrase [Mariniflexile gromovii]|uniref:Site-specific integrase n=1 Tax=Mariniflexile gromovii TaxID=362523 RepID=A0ABS4BYD6_9FLAO|nr:site-specific integrase [Mariniflexile gromovii]MBP0905600.1 site-specific integrase [Mariniflexile gromovii]